VDVIAPSHNELQLTLVGFNITVGVIVF
jgi:hypothetical protein